MTASGVPAIGGAVPQVLSIPSAEDQLGADSDGLLAKIQVRSSIAQGVVVLRVFKGNVRVEVFPATSTAFAIRVYVNARYYFCKVMDGTYRTASPMRGFQNGPSRFKLWVPMIILIASDDLAFPTQQLGTRASSARRRQPPSSSSSTASQSLLAAIVESSDDSIIWMKDHHSEFQHQKSMESSAWRPPLGETGALRNGSH
jgi:hypothetical protein